MTPSSRAAALRSTVLATGLALAVGLSACGGRCRGQAKSSTAEAAADRAQRRAQDRARAAKNTPPKIPRRRGPRSRRRGRRRSSPRRASTRPCRRRKRANRPSRPRWPRPHRPRRPTPRRWKTSSNWSASTSPRTRPRPKRRYRIRWRGNSPNGSSCAATTTAPRSSAIAPSSRPIRVGPRRPSCAGASKPRCGTTIATTPPYGRGSKTNRRCRPKANSRWRARCWRAATGPMPSAWCATPGETMPCRRIPKTPRSICSARC